MATPFASGTYQIYPSFAGTDGVMSATPFLLPPAFMFNGPSTIPIPFLYVGDENFAGYHYENADFKIAFQQLGEHKPITEKEPAQKTVSTTVTLLAANMWKAAPAARAALRGSFVDFLQQVEAQFELKKIIVPGGTARIAQHVADWLPAPLDETLFYRYSFSSGLDAGTLPYVDLRSGMRLQLETQMSQFISPSSSSNGYITAGHLPIMVSSASASDGRRRLVFNPFLGAIKAPMITGGSASPIVAGGVIDLQPAGGPDRYWRLIYPQSMAGPLLPGDMSIGHNVTLVAADTLADMNAATATYPQPAKGIQTTLAIFLGRSIAIPEIPVRLTIGTASEELTYVPLGTTLGNVAERMSMLPLDPMQRTISLRRVTSATGGTAMVMVTFFVQTLAALSTSMYDLPLIAGDSVTLTF